MNKDKARAAAVREQSAELAAALGLPGPSREQGGNLTVLQHQMLAQLAAAPKGAATPEQLIAAYPGLYGHLPVRSATYSLHRVGRHLIEMGLAKAGRVQERSASTGRVQGGRRTYRVTEAGRRALKP